MEINDEILLELWEMVSDHLPPSRRNETAVRFLKVFLDQDIELSDLESIRGEDEHLDYAFDQLESNDDDEFEEMDEYED